MNTVHGTSISLPVADIVSPGARGVLQVVGWGPEMNAPAQERQADRSERSFAVVGHLGKFNSAGLAELRADLTDDDGASFLRVPARATGLTITFPAATLRPAFNRDGEISAIHYECVATSPEEAHSLFLEASLPMLDKLSYDLNVPVFLNAVRIDDLRNHVTVIEYVSPFKSTDILLGSITVEPEIKAIYAMHREAVNASSDFYRFFCYYKVLEGLLGAARSQLFVRAKQRGLRLARRKLLVPDMGIPDSPYNSHIGSPIKAFFDATLTPVMRNAMAHFMVDNGGVLNLSSPDHLYGYSAAIPVSRMCARLVTDDYQTLLREFHAHDA